jgi:hypothetical protein
MNFPNVVVPQDTIFLMNYAPNALITLSLSIMMIMMNSEIAGYTYITFYSSKQSISSCKLNTGSV